MTMIYRGNSLPAREHDFNLQCSQEAGIFVDSLRCSSFGVRKYFFTTGPNTAWVVSETNHWKQDWQLPVQQGSKSQQSD